MGGLYSLVSCVRISSVTQRYATGKTIGNFATLAGAVSSRALITHNLLRFAVDPLVQSLEGGGCAYQELQSLDILTVERRSHVDVDDVAER